jgi:hypothetical protein
MRTHLHTAGSYGITTKELKAQLDRTNGTSAKHHACIQASQAYAPCLYAKLSPLTQSGMHDMTKQVTAEKRHLIKGYLLVPSF